MEILKKRADFLSVAKAGRVHKSAFTLQFKDKLEEEARFGVNTRFGFTVTKKVGNAVVRNRIKRRLKAAVRGLKISDAHKDYVLIARLPALSMKYQSIVSELEVALAHSQNMQSHKNNKGSQS